MPPPVMCSMRPTAPFFWPLPNLPHGTPPPVCDPLESFSAAKPNSRRVRCQPSPPGLPPVRRTGVLSADSAAVHRLALDWPTVCPRLVRFFPTCCCGGQPGLQLLHGSIGIYVGQGAWQQLPTGAPSTHAQGRSLSFFSFLSPQAPCRCSRLSCGSHPMHKGRMHAPLPPLL